MNFPMNFIKATDNYCTFENYVSAPYFRKSFEITKGMSNAELLITGLGFYRVFINGKEITKGFLAPYRSNIDDYIYYDKYQLKDMLKSGKNTLGLILGNGMRNALGGFVWDFDKARFRGAPETAFSIKLLYSDGSSEEISSNTDVKTAPSPIIFDDLHFGEYYDARLNIPDWNLPDFDDSQWKNALTADLPRGETKLCDVEPIRIQREIKPVKIFKSEGSYIYDFGINSSGLCRLKINGRDGQEIFLQYFEVLKEGKPHLENLRFRSCDKIQEDRYICSGNGTEEYVPSFTYHGFRYVCVTGIDETQATEDLLTYLEIYSDIEKIGEFSCSDEIVNKIQEATVRSDFSNFWYFPTDCPQREKNGWTGDASLSAEQMLFNMSAEKSYKEWLRNVYKAMKDSGEIPGIIPTTGWGYIGNGHVYNGPAWDGAIVNIPYYTYIYRGDTDILEELADPLMRYLNYLYSKLDEDDLLAIGLGDWCEVRSSENEWGKASVPLVVTDTVIAFDIANKAAFIYGVLKKEPQKQFAESLSNRLRKAFRSKLIDMKTFEVNGKTQSGQAMAIYYGMFDDSEKEKALGPLIDYIKAYDGHFHGGVLGSRVIYRVLVENGMIELAYNMIVRPDYPSYGNWIFRGATSLWEDFHPETGTPFAIRETSHNHHFWGDVSAWFYRYLAGINVNPQKTNSSNINIEPYFVKELKSVRASYKAVGGTIEVKWKREGKYIILNITANGNIFGDIKLPDGFLFEDGSTQKPLQSGEFVLKFENNANK